MKAICVKEVQRNKNCDLDGPHNLFYAVHDKILRAEKKTEKKDKERTLDEKKQKQCTVD